jgi:hypothetical protein
MFAFRVSGEPVVDGGVTSGCVPDGTPGRFVEFDGLFGPWDTGSPEAPEFVSELTSKQALSAMPDNAISNPDLKPTFSILRHSFK